MQLRLVAIPLACPSTHRHPDARPCTQISQMEAEMERQKRIEELEATRGGSLGAESQKRYQELEGKYRRLKQSMREVRKERDSPR